MRWYHLILPAFAVSLFATAALAGGGGGHGEAHHLNWWTWSQTTPPVGWFIVDFILFVGLLYYFAKDKVVVMFKNRHETVKTEIESAQKEHNLAKAHHDEYRDKLSRVDEETETLLGGAKKDGAEERDRIVTQAKEYAERLHKDTSMAVEQEVRMARRRLHHQEVSEVLRRAGEMLEREVNQNQQARLLEHAIVELERGELKGVGEGARAGGAS